MSEQIPPTHPKKPPIKKNSSAVQLTFGFEESEKKSPPRKKPTTTSMAMTVDMPGKPLPKKHVKTEQPAKKKQPVKKQQPTQKQQPAKQVEKKKVQRTTSKSSASPKKTAPTKKQREAVVPPKIGTRKGYKTPLVFWFRFPVLIAAFFLCALALFFVFHKQEVGIGAYIPSHTTITVVVEPGMSAKAVSKVLAEKGVTDDEQALLQYFIDHEVATLLQSGSFIMERRMPFSAIVEQLTARPVSGVLEVSPSFTLAVIDRYLQNRGHSKAGEFLKAATELQKRNSLSFVEGWLLSGVYPLPSDNVARNLAQAMFDAMLALVQPHLDSPMVEEWSLEQVLIIASMIQAETQNSEEMPLIASVIYNRLRAGQPLGIDATTRYELDDWENPIPKKALETHTPYNTRRKVGLPPSGICSPSEVAVLAALFPLESPYFYYLHGLDKRLYPAITYNEHLENIKKYR